jgi:hypothetical protein
MRNLFIVSCFWLTTVVAFCADVPVRIAILAGEGDRAPKAGVVELLEVDVSGRDAVVLLERAAIDKVLAEQELAALSLSDPATAVRLGKLLALALSGTGCEHLDYFRGVVFLSVVVVPWSVVRG